MTSKWVSGYIPPSLSVSGAEFSVGMQWKNIWSSTVYTGKYDMETWCRVVSQNGKWLSDRCHVGLGVTESDTYKYDRTLYYPFKPAAKLKYVDTWLRWVGYSQRKDKKGKPIADSWYKDRGGNWMKGPRLTLRAPSAPKIELDVSSSASGSPKEITVKVTKPSSDYRTDVYDIVIVGTKTTPKTQKNPTQPSSSTSVILNRNLLSGKASRRTVTDSTFEQSFDVSTIENGLKPGQWVDITFHAYCRGLAGDSPIVKATHIFAAPATPQITKVTTYGTRATGYTIVALKTNAQKHKPVDSVTLQRLYNTDATTAAQAASLTGWADVISDDGDCIALRDANALCWPPEGEDGRGKRTWYRIKAVHDGLTTYSAPVAHPKRYPQVTLSNPSVKIIDIGSQGAEEAWVDVVFQDFKFNTSVSDDEKRKYTYETEISWSTDPNAWNSTSQPSTYAFDWKDPSSRYPGWANSAKVFIDDLAPGETVYVSARRNYTYNGTTTYGNWCAVVMVTPQKPPEWIEVDAPAAILRGEPIPVSWEIEGDLPQREWVIDNDAGPNEAVHVLARGTGSLRSCNLEYDRYEELAKGAKAMRLCVRVLAGGGWAASEPLMLVIDDKPTCSLMCNSVVTSMPFALNVDADGEKGRVQIKSRGIAFALPDGGHRQAEGEIVAAMGQAKVIRIDSGDFVDGCVYDVVAQSYREATGTASGEAKCSFRVDWRHKPTAPDAIVTPDQDNMSAVIEVVAPKGASPTDVCDVYRVTPDMVYLIAESLSFGDKILDSFAPFASRSHDVRPSYRVATRTKEGAVAWADLECGLVGDGIRLDWDGKHVELPYNVELGGSVEKDFDARHHFDEKLPEGFWNPGITRNASLSTDLIKLESAEQRSLVAEMARFSGPVFVRLGNGSAYEANVQLTDMSESYGSGALSISLSAKEIALTQEHMATRYDEEVANA